MYFNPHLEKDVLLSIQMRVKDTLTKVDQKIFLQIIKKHNKEIASKSNSAINVKIN